MLEVPTIITQVLVHYGLPAALVVYFIYRDHQREKMMALRIEKLEKEMRSILTDLVTKTTRIIVANADAMKDWVTVLKIRPCIADKLADKMLSEKVAEKIIDTNIDQKKET